MLTFEKVFDNPLSKYLILEIISCMQWLFWVVYDNKKGIWDQLLMQISCMIFPLKYFLFNALSIIKDSMPYLFSFLRYQIKCVIKFLFRQLMVLSTFEIYLGSSSRAMADREKKGEDGNKI